MRGNQAIALLLVALVTTPAFAQRLPGTVVPDHYDLTFNVDLANGRFTGLETIHVRVLAPTSSVVLNALDLQLQDVTIEADAASQKATVSTSQHEQTATFSVRQPLPSGPAEIRIRYAGALSDQLRGFYRGKTTTRKYAVTQFESTDARRAFPCFDEPALKATFTLTLIIDRKDTAISNGKVLSDTPGPGRAEHTVKFATSPKMSSYLVAMAVGDFRCLDGSQDGVPIRVCATSDKTNLGRIALESTQQILRFYDGYYTIRYPFGKLDLVAVPDFDASGMENTAAIFFRESDLLADDRTASATTRKNIASVVAHEVAHQWFGDLVTMRWWDDLWLNEGFATWMSMLPLEAWKPQWNVAVDEASENQEALALDSLKATHAIRAAVESPDDIEGAFDTITYEKGAAVLRMIEGYVGAETFRSGINAYLQAHAYGNATSQDFWNAITSTSRLPVDTILPTFVNQAGVPLIEITPHCEDNGTITRGTFRQQRFTLTPGSDDAARATVWQVPVCTRIQGSSSPGSCTVIDREQEVVELAHGCPSWVFINAGAHGYYRTAYPPEMLRAMAPEIETALTAPERLTLAEDEWALVHGGRHSAADYLTIASGFAGEQTSGVLRLVTTGLQFIDQYLTTDTARPKLQSFVQSLFRRSFDALGLEATEGDTDDRRALRGVLIAALGTTGADADVVARSRAAVDRALGGGAPLDGAAASALIQVAAGHGDTRLYAALAAAAEHAASPQAHDRYVNALAGFRDPALIDRALQEAQASRMQIHDTARYMAQFFANPAARERAWVFLKQNWTDLEPKLRIGSGDASLARSLGAFCDARMRDDIRTFFAAHKMPSAVPALDAALDRIDNCIELRQQQTPIVTGWLNR
jgi:aminopeptidase N